ncbi:hypothetical protein [Serinicoccus sediminis]|uniref:hypothetical protein n=1 Tax=Serinicoccus sediminis TaxID=2306021 RepID=UPI0010201D3A|nr:hypothetical protein [Serinicoccus sediminis]
MELWTLAILPVLLVLAPLVWKDLISPRVNPERDKPDESTTVVVGQPVQGIDWDARLVDDFDREQLEHRLCHSVMRDHGITIPHD